MFKTNRIVRGCLVLALVGCLMVGAGAMVAIERLHAARAAHPLRSTLFELGPLYFGSPCAELRVKHPTVRCKTTYYIVVRFTESPLWALELP